MADEKSSGNIQQIDFLSGEIVPVSGVWRLNHEDCGNYCELWLPKESFFPPCPTCGFAATFTLLEEVQHISEDPDFS